MDSKREPTESIMSEHLDDGDDDYRFNNFDILFILGIITKIYNNLKDFICIFTFLVSNRFKILLHWNSYTSWYNGTFNIYKAFTF